MPKNRETQSKLKHKAKGTNVTNIKNTITRKNKYYNGEKYIIGYEDSMVGYRALKNITDIIYLYDNISVFAKNDCYIFDDFFTLIF